MAKGKAGRPKVKAKDMAEAMASSGPSAPEPMTGGMNAPPPDPLVNAVHDCADELARIATALEKLAGRPPPLSKDPPTVVGLPVKEAPPAEPVPPDVATETLRVAAAVGVAKVKALLGKFGVQKAVELSEADRPKYLKALATL